MSCDRIISGVGQIEPVDIEDAEVFQPFLGVPIDTHRQRGHSEALFL
jgi:hypothetical protein